MPERFWSNDELRTFLTALRSGGVFDRGAAVDDVTREAFRSQAMQRIVPDVTRRVLADVGAAIDPRGAAAIAIEVAEDTTWGARHTWLMVTDDPWAYLTDLVVREITKAYRGAVRRRGDGKVLDGITAASSRHEIGTGGGEDAEDRS